MQQMPVACAAQPSVCQASFIGSSHVACCVCIAQLAMHFPFQYIALHFVHAQPSAKQWWEANVRTLTKGCRHGLPLPVHADASAEA